MSGAGDTGRQVAVYYFPNYHVDPRNEAVHGPGWTEWELVRRAEPRFAGHRQPRVPLWGYQDEADPAVFARKIDAAADHGVDCFLFDWYWYDDGPFLERALERGYLQAPNNDRLGFALMWANHDWRNLHPRALRTPPPVLQRGAIARETFDRVAEYVIERYFRHPSYWLIDGCPYFSVYQLSTLIAGLGGAAAAGDALRHFRDRTRAAGFPDLHLNAVTRGVGLLPGERAMTEPAELVAELGFSSVTPYVWVHDVKLWDFPVTDYRAVLEEVAERWRRATGGFSVPYYPNVTMGWDASPRTLQSDRFLNVGYPFGATLGDNSPEAFRTALARAKAFVDARPGQPRIVTINAWNEWTEGSYLEPDTVHGLGYLEAIREVFGGDGDRHRRAG